MKKLLILLIVVALATVCVQAQYKNNTPVFTKTVGTANELQNALVNAKNGDVIGI